MKISVVIAVYNDYKSLFVVLKSLENQTYKEFEVIIAEDCNKNEMIEFLNKNKFKLDIQHIFQEDMGFRKNKILNKAVKVSNGNYFIFIDGDCMLHKDFVAEYNKKFNENTLLIGRRVMLSKSLSEKIKKRFHIPNLFEIFFSKSNHKEEGLKLPDFISKKNINGLIGSNFGISKNLILKINGFDEDYEAIGVGEDDDIYMRLKKVEGLKFLSIRNRAIQYHLWHFRNPIENNNRELFLKKKQGDFFCENGLIKKNKDDER